MYVIHQYVQLFILCSFLALNVQHYLRLNLVDILVINASMVPAACRTPSIHQLCTHRSQLYICWQVWQNRSLAAECVAVCQISSLSVYHTSSSAWYRSAMQCTCQGCCLWFSWSTILIQSAWTQHKCHHEVDIVEYGLMLWGALPDAHSETPRNRWRQTSAAFLRSC